MPDDLSDGETEPVAERMANHLGEFFKDYQGAMLIKWTLQAEVIDDDGSRALWTLASPDISVWDEMGMYRYRLSMLDGRVAAVEAQD